MHGKLDVHALIITGIDEKKFRYETEKVWATEDDEPIAAVPTNKWEMLSIAGWATILERVTKSQWSVEQLHQ